MKVPFLCILCLCCVGVVKAEEEGLKVVPPNIAVQPGETVTLKCTPYPEEFASDGQELDWFLPDGTVPISDLILNQTAMNLTDNKLLRYQSSNGTLTIVNATVNDSGTYICRKGSVFEVTSLVKVYIMPEYTTAITVVLVINAVLIVIFIMCAVWNVVKERKTRNVNKRRQKLGHKDIAIRALKD